MKRVVVVSAIAPPQPNAGAARVEGLARYLPECGWLATVVSSRFAGEGAVGGAQTHRVGDPLYLYRRLRHRAGENGEVPRELTHVAAPARGAKALLLGALTCAVPDPYAGWIPGAAIATIRAARKERADAILSTSPPESSHLAALIAAQVTGLPWLAEFRDGWMFESLRPPRSKLRTEVEQRLEQIVCSRADELVGVTRGIAADLELRFGRGNWVPNGFDDTLVPQSAVAEAKALLDPSYFNVVYTGTFWVSRVSQSPKNIAQAMEAIRSRPGGDKIRLTIMGALHPDERALLDPIEGIHLEQHRPRATALALQQVADALLVVAPAKERAVVPGKFFDYLGSGRPLIAVADRGSELAALAEEVKAAAIVPTNDPTALAESMLALATGKLEPPTKPERFHRRRAAAEIAQLLTRITEQT